MFPRVCPPLETRHLPPEILGYHGSHGPLMTLCTYFSAGTHTDPIHVLRALPVWSSMTLVTRPMKAGERRAKRHSSACPAASTRPRSVFMREASQNRTAAMTSAAMPITQPSVTIPVPGQNSSTAPIMESMIPTVLAV